MFKEHFYFKLAIFVKTILNMLKSIYFVLLHNDKLNENQPD
jgi:hypothetical protein